MLAEENNKSGSPETEANTYLSSPEKFSEALNPPQLGKLAKRAVEEQGHDLTRESTRRLRRALLATGSTAVVSSIFGIVPQSVPTLELTVSPVVVRAALLASLIYLLLSWWLESSADRSLAQSRFLLATEALTIAFEERMSALRRGLKDIQDLQKPYLDWPVDSRFSEIREELAKAKDSIPRYLGVEMADGDFSSPDGVEKVARDFKSKVDDRSKLAQQALDTTAKAEHEVRKLGLDIFLKVYRFRVFMIFRFPTCVAVVAIVLLVVALCWAPDGLGKVLP